MLDDRDEFEKKPDFHAEFETLLRIAVRDERQRQEARFNNEVFNLIAFAIWIVSVVVCGLGWLAS